MTKYQVGKNKHLTLEARTEIQSGLDRGLTYKAIGKIIGKDQTTVSKEVKKHLTVRESKVVRRNEQGDVLPKEPCPQLLKAPFVCNACPRRRSNCQYDRQFYLATHAHDAYKETLSEARTGIALNNQEFYENDRIISEGIRNGQHLYHILQTHSLGVSKSSIYRYVKKGYLSLNAIDFPRIVKFKPRKKKSGGYVPAALKVGRTYQDFELYCQDSDIPSWVEMDTVIGRIGGKCILTFVFTFCNFMVGLLLDNKTSAEVSGKIIAMKERLAKRNLRFGDIFPVILTDNGGEFADVFTVENDLDNTKETSLFFCDPNKANQKPHVEKDHSMLRDILPKGSSFDNLTQDAVDVICSHINSVKRKNLNGKSSFEVFAFTFGNEVPVALGILPIPPEEVVQSPRLLRLIQDKSDHQ